MTAVYLAAKLLTFPGAFLKAFWEHCILKLLRVPVEDASFLHLNELFGHIEHSLIEGKAKNMLFCMLPGLINGLLSVPLLFTSSVNLFYLGVGMKDAVTGLTNIMFFVYVIMFWVGMSLWCSKYPLYEDALQLKEKLHSEDAGRAKKALSAAPVAVITAGSLLERYGINVLLFAGATAALVYLFPYAFV
mgnify:CR=1 FL=1